MQAGTGRKDLGGGLRQARLGLYGHSAHALMTRNVSTLSPRKKSDESLVCKVAVYNINSLPSFEVVVLGKILCIHAGAYHFKDALREESFKVNATVKIWLLQGLRAAFAMHEGPF